MDAIALQLPQLLPHLFSFYFFLKRNINILSSQQMDIFLNKFLQKKYGEQITPVKVRLYETPNNWAEIQ